MKISNILISQPAPASLEKSPFAELTEIKGLKIDFIPFIKIEGVSGKEFRSQRVDILAHTAVIFTSRGNIDNFFRICEECRITIPDDMKYFCSTETIALYLQKYIVYRKRKIFFGMGSFADLMEIIIKHKEEKFLLALSEPHKPEIPKGLDKAKIKYDKVIMARTVGKDFEGTLDISKYNMLVFYSPTEIAALKSNFGTKLPKNISIATFGTGTADVAVKEGYDVKVLAPTTQFPSMISALSNYIKLKDKGEDIDTSYIQDSIKAAQAFNEQVLAKVKTVKTKRVVSGKTSKTKKSATTATTTKRTTLKSTL